MSVKETAAYAMYPRTVALPEVVSALNQAGFENEDICMVLSPAHPVATVVGNATIIGDIAGEESARSARMIGWVSKFGAVVIPTVGFFIRSQAFFHAASESEPSFKPADWVAGQFEIAGLVDFGSTLERSSTISSTLHT